MNKFMFTGRLTRDPETRETANGTKVAHYTLAVDRPRRNGEDQGADFFRITAYAGTAEFVSKYLRKGVKIIAEGRITTGSYTDKETGKTVYTTDFIVNNHEFCEPRRSNPGAPAETGEKTAEAAGDGFMPAPEDEELPFI